MAGFWIPWEIGLASKREVLMIAKLLKIDRRIAATMCMEVWAWAQEQSLDGMVMGMSPSDVSSAVSVPGLGEAMTIAGWIVESENMIQFPNWQRFNGKSAKKRLQGLERKRTFDTSHKKK